ncbi:hypothetical protein KJ654_03605 [Patescibacteria group bacterium]|nr:hypothetical protein [Patescibacteria group bacterium]
MGEVKPNYQYKETIFIYGDLNVYLKDLESYFRDNIMHLSGSVNRIKKHLDRLNWKIEHCERDGYFLSGEIGNREVNEENYDEIKAWLEEEVDLESKLVKAQRINQTNIISILVGRETILSLDAKNYFIENHVTSIKFDCVDRESIRMRLFFDENSNECYDSENTNGYVFYANTLPELEAEIVEENDVNEKIPTLNEFIENRSIIRSKLRVRDPIFEVSREGDKTKYSVKLSDAEVEMLNCFNKDVLGKYSVNANSLHNASITWTVGQAKKILRNLYGLVAIHMDSGFHWT